MYAIRSYYVNNEIQPSPDFTFAIVIFHVPPGDADRITSYNVCYTKLLRSVYFISEMKENTRMETDLDEYMPKDHPAFVYSDEAESWFNIKDGIVVAVENKSGIYNTATLDTRITSYNVCYTKLLRSFF